MNVYLFMSVVFVLSLMDIVYTFTNVNILRKHIKNWRNTEYSPLVRTSWHMFGFFNGTVIAAAITLASVLAITYLIGDKEFMQGILIGMYIVIHHYHHMNYAYIRHRYLGKKSGWVERILSNI